MILINILSGFILQQIHREYDGSLGVLKENLLVNRFQWINSFLVSKKIKIKIFNYKNFVNTNGSIYNQQWDRKTFQKKERDSNFSKKKKIQKTYNDSN